MATESELEKRRDIALAKLGVAEELRWFVAVPLGFVLGIVEHSWLIGLGVGVATFALVTYWYNREYDAANDAYQRATGTGKYYEQSKDDDAA